MMYVCYRCDMDLFKFEGKEELLAKTRDLEAKVESLGQSNADLLRNKEEYKAKIKAQANELAAKDARIEELKRQSQITDIRGYEIGKRVIGLEAENAQLREQLENQRKQIVALQKYAAVMPQSYSVGQDGKVSFHLPINVQESAALRSEVDRLKQEVRQRDESIATLRGILDKYQAQGFDSATKAREEYDSLSLRMDMAKKEIEQLRHELKRAEGLRVAANDAKEAILAMHKRLRDELKSLIA